MATPTRAATPHARSRMHAHIFLLALSNILSRSAAFVLMGAGTHKPESLPGKAYRWNVPWSGSSSSGLGGGLGWVVDESFCDDIIGKFPERDLINGIEIKALQFVHCSDIIVALNRGFATWSANHRMIQFADLSSAPPCMHQASRKGKLSDSCPWELFIGTADGTEFPNLAAYVINHRQSSLDRRWYDQKVRAPSGSEVSGVDAYARSVMRFQTHLCWYLDATFCWYFQQWRESHNVDVLLVVRAVLLAVFGLAALRLAMVVFWIIVALCCLGDQKKTTVRKRGNLVPQSCSAVLDYLSSLSPCANVILIFCLIFPPIFYERIFLPCWECYDFEAAIAHETGHVLGFGHPDAIPTANLVGACNNLNNATCRNPFYNCAATRPYKEDDKSIMHSMTQNNPRTCLSIDDMAGLHLLYPLCDKLVPTSVVCDKGRRLSGWLRLAIVVGVPFLIAVVLILVPLSCLRCRDQARMRRLRSDLGSAQSDLREYHNAITVQLMRDRVNGSRPMTALRKLADRGNRVAPAPPGSSATRGGKAGGGGKGGGGKGGGDMKLEDVAEGEEMQWPTPSEGPVPMGGTGGRGQRGIPPGGRR